MPVARASADANSRLVLQRGDRGEAEIRGENETATGTERRRDPAGLWPATVITSATENKPRTITSGLFSVALVMTARAKRGAPAARDRDLILLCVARLLCVLGVS